MNCDTDRIIAKYLEQRYANKSRDETLSIVFDITQYCNLRCNFCGTNALYTDKSNIKCDDREEIISCLHSLYDFALEKHLNVNLFLGGGEPFLRSDTFEILKYAASLFGADNINIDTNGLFPNSTQVIEKALNYSTIGISVNNDFNEQKRKLLRKICSDTTNRDRIEVTTVALKQSVDTIPMLMKEISLYNVKRFSVHRAMPFGRLKTEMIPSAEEYRRLFVTLIQLSEECQIDFHMHHSIEHIYASLLNIKAPSQTICIVVGDTMVTIPKNVRIDKNGTIYISSWGNGRFWNQFSLFNVFNQELMFDCKDEKDLVKRFLSPNNRCSRCDEAFCRGGDRMAAMAQGMSNHLNANNADDVCFDYVDMACPKTIKENTK